MERRNVGIDLLKLVLMFMVCVLHTLTQGGALIACEPETATARGLWLICAFSMCAVDCFAMITGFTASGKPLALTMTDGESSVTVTGDTAAPRRAAP